MNTIEKPSKGNIRILKVLHSAMRLTSFHWVFASGQVVGLHEHIPIFMTGASHCQIKLNVNNHNCFKDGPLDKYNILFYIFVKKHGHTKTKCRLMAFLQTLVIVSESVG